METDIQILQDEAKGFCLTITSTDDRTAALFDELDLQGGGYTWQGILRALVSLKMPEVLGTLQVGAEADNLYAYCADRAVLGRVADLVRAACADHEILQAAVQEAGDELE